jgi:hypothetical protein
MIIELDYQNDYENSDYKYLEFENIFRKNKS